MNRTGPWAATIVAAIAAVMAEPLELVQHGRHAAFDPMVLLTMLTVVALVWYTSYTRATLSLLEAQAKRETDARDEARLMMSMHLVSVLERYLLNVQAGESELPPLQDLDDGSLTQVLAVPSLLAPSAVAAALRVRWTLDALSVQLRQLESVIAEADDAAAPSHRAALEARIEDARHAASEAVRELRARCKEAIAVARAFATGPGSESVT